MKRKSDLPKFAYEALIAYNKDFNGLNILEEFNIAWIQISLDWIICNKKSQINVISALRIIISSNDDNINLDLL